jgi:hypothetical protein
MEWEEGLRMAQHMKDQDASIKAAIMQCQGSNHGVVALKFSNECRQMAIEILDEPYDDQVRVYPA